MKTLLTLLLLAASAFGQTATISDTIRTPFGGTFSGTVTVTLNSPALAQPLYSGSVTLSGWTQAVTVTAGVFTLTLYTNDLITPGGTSYTATYAPTSGSGWKETWIVPTGATTIREIRSTTVPSPSVRFTPSQITQAGATLGQGLKWDGSKWAPADVVANPMTTNGDLITRLGGVPVRVGIGSTNQVLTVAGGMPVWASGITGNASTASALAANGANCTAGSFPLGVDASGNAESCTAAVTASTGLSDSAALVRNNQANTYTAGSKQTFASNATTAGAAFGGGITADPSSVTAGDFWYRTDLGTFGFRNASAVDALVAGGRALSTVGSVPFVTSSGVLGQNTNFRFFNGTGNLVVGTTTDDGVNRLQVAGSARIALTAAQTGLQVVNTTTFSSMDIIGATEGNITLQDTGAPANQQAFNLNVNDGALLFRVLNDARTGVNAVFGRLSANGEWRFHDERATVGSTSLVVRAGAGQGSNFLQRWQNSAGSTLSFISQTGGLGIQALDIYNETALTTRGLSIYGNGTASFIDASSNARMNWYSATNLGGSADLSLSRASANTLQVGDGGANANGIIRAAGVETFGGYFALLNAGGTLNEVLIQSNVDLASSRLLRFSSTTNANGTKDLSLSRASANTLQVGDGGANSNGTILARIHTWANGTEGTCDATLRGQVVMVQGGAGVADTFRICRKDAANAYAWTALY